MTLRATIGSLHQMSCRKQTGRISQSEKEQLGDRPLSNVEISTTESCILSLYHGDIISLVRMEMYEGDLPIRIEFFTAHLQR